VERARELLKRARTLKKLAARKLRNPARKLRRRLTRKLRTLVRQLNTLGPRLRMLRWRLGSERQLISRSSSWAGYRSLRAVDRAAEEAQAAYVAGSYSGAVVHFLSEESVAIGLHDGWAELAENLELERVPGDHFTLVREPHVQVLAERLTAQAEAVEAR
jgi:thioesterase domain-containing protein